MDATRKKRKYTPRKPSLRVCNECREEYLTTANNSKFCGESCQGRDRYRRNRDVRLQAVRDRRESNRDEINARRRERYKERRAEMRASNRRNYLKHRERRIADAIAYQAANPQVVALTRSRRRAAKAFKITQRDHRRLLERFNNSCAYCKVELAEWGRSKPNSLQWDHVLPLSKGGSDSVGNILPACMECNSSKSAQFLSVWKITRELSRLQEADDE